MWRLLRIPALTALGYPVQRNCRGRQDAVNGRRSRSATVTGQSPPRDPGQPRRTAMNLLSRREHSTRELKRKLKVRGMEGAAVDQVLATLQQQQLLSDERFVEMLVHSRVGKGQGPLRIQGELREHGVSDELVSAAVDVNDPQWHGKIKEVRHKRFGASMPANVSERAKQIRFLQYRGFTPEQIHAVFKSQGDDE